MKILFVSSSPLEYSSSANMRNIALLNGLIENGHEITTLTPRPQEDSKFFDNSLNNIQIKEKKYIELGALRSKMTIKKNKKNLLRKYVYNILSKFKIYDFRSDLANRKIIIDNKFDLIISSSDPKSSHLIAESLLKNNKNIAKRWIQYWGDPFASDINKKSWMPKSIIRKEEERLISLADKVVYVSPFTCESQKRLYKKYDDKICFIPIPYEKEIYYKKTNNKKTILGYFGDYKKSDRNILPLYDTICEIDNICDLNICGNSDLELLQKENIKIFERQNLDNIRKLESKTDILICICNKRGTQIPGKVYHYAATNKPILLILDGDNKKELREYFSKFNRYIMCDNNKIDIEKTLKDIIDNPKEYFPCEQLKPKSIAKKFVE